MNFKENKPRVAFNMAKAKAPEKKIINTYLAKNGNRDGIAIILDGSQLGTSQILIQHGWNKKNIHIPNISLPDYLLIKRKGYNTYNKSLLSFLKDNIPTNIGLLYMDYMCNIDGSEKCRPLEDIAFIFENRLLIDGCCLAITINQRRYIKNGLFSQGAIIKLISHITEQSASNGYNIVLNDTAGSYKNGRGAPMVTLIFTVIKQ